MRRLYRSTSNRMLAGVLGGLGEYFNLDATLIRLIFVVLLFASLFTFAFAYLIAILIIPNDPGVY